VKPILATRPNKPETLLTKENLLNEKAKNLKTCLLKTKIQNMNLKKNATAKKLILNF